MGRIVGMLMPYRNIYLRLFANGDLSHSPRIASDIHAALSSYGLVEVIERGSYWKIPKHLEFGVNLCPDSSVRDGMGSIMALATGAWADDVWAGEGRFLTDEVRWAWIVGEEAQSLPIFEQDQVVRIADCPLARNENVVGARAVVHGSSVSSSDGWSYSVMPEGSDELICFDESELAG